MSGLPQPELHKDAKFVFLSDWDGTITEQDSNDYLTDNLGFGAERRKALNAEILAGTNNFRDTFRAMLASVAENHSFDECKEVLRKHISLDPGFKECYTWCKANGVPFIIVSSGMAPLIRSVLANLIGEEEAAQIEIIANDVRFTTPEGSAQKHNGWEVVWRHPESGFGHDKSQSIIPYRSTPAQPTLFFAGDGVSDLSAARHADLLFTKVGPSGESDLKRFCERESIPHVVVRDFAKIKACVEQVVSGQKTYAQVIADKGN